MKNRTNTLLWILAVVFLVGLMNSSKITWVDVRQPLIITSIGVWLTALATLLSRRDIEIHSKLTWVVTVLLLNGIGGLFYFIFGPSRKDTERKQRE